MVANQPDRGLGRPPQLPVVPLPSGPGPQLAPSPQSRAMPADQPPMAHPSDIGVDWPDFTHA